MTPMLPLKTYRRDSPYEYEVKVEILRIGRWQVTLSRWETHGEVIRNMRKLYAFVTAHWDWARNEQKV